MRRVVIAGLFEQDAAFCGKQRGNDCIEYSGR